MAEIFITTTGLSSTLFLIPGRTSGWVDGAASAVVSLDPGTYSFQVGSGFLADFTFVVHADGTVGFEERFNAFLSVGRGGRELVVRGFTVRLDLTGLSHGVVPMLPGGPGWLLPDRVHELTLVPGSHYQFHPASGITADFIFGVGLDGNVVVRAPYTDVAIASGPTLTIQGRPIRLDVRSLSHDLLMLVVPPRYVPRDAVTELRMIPASGYGFVSASGVVTSFTMAVRLDGTVSVDPVGGYATASGSTVTIHGYRIRIDGRGLSHDLLPLLLGWTTGFLPRRTLNELTLVPAVHYGFQPGSGIVGDFTFAIRSDGSIAVPPSCTGFLRVTGTDTLVVGGYAIVVDGSRADSALLSIVNVGIPAATATHLFAVLVPCDGYQLQTASGVFSYGFGVERDGSITVDPRVPPSSHAVNTIPRLEIIGTTPW